MFFILATTAPVLVIAVQFEGYLIARGIVYIFSSGNPFHRLLFYNMNKVKTVFKNRFEGQ